MRQTFIQALITPPPNPAWFSSLPFPGTVQNKPTIVDLKSLPPTPCPCGIARRALADCEEFPGTVHLTEISQDARTHYHKAHTEVYVVLECESDAKIQLDEAIHDLRPQMSIVIPPGVRHRAIGRMTVLIVCSPNFDPKDEYFD